MFQEYFYELIAAIILLTLIVIYFLTRKFNEEEKRYNNLVEKESKEIDPIIISDKIQEDPEDEAFRLDEQEEGSFGNIKENPFENTAQESQAKEARKKCKVPDHGKIRKENFKDFNGAKILVAEDNIINQKVIKGLLQGSGIEITIADDGQIALDILEKNSDFNMILMDAHMPRVDGFEATRMIRANPAYEHIVVVALSGDTAVDDIRKMTESGMEEHLAKPLKMEDFYNVLYAYTKNHLDNIPQVIEVIKTRELNGDKGLDICGNDEEFYKDILREFTLTYTDTSHKIIDLLKDNEIKLADALLLDFIGITANIGADNIRSIALDLKELISDTEERSYLTILDDFEIHLEVLLRDIDNYLT